MRGASSSLGQPRRASRRPRRRATSGSGAPDVTGRAVHSDRLADHPGDRHRAPEATVVRAASVVAHQEHEALWDSDRARKVALRSVLAGRCERLALERAVADHMPVSYPDPVTAHTDDALDERLRRGGVSRPG